MNQKLFVLRTESRKLLSLLLHAWIESSKDFVALCYAALSLMGGGGGDNTAAAVSVREKPIARGKTKLMPLLGLSEIPN